MYGNVLPDAHHQIVKGDEGVLLIHDAVVALRQMPPEFFSAIESLAGKQIGLYALQEDCEARGIQTDDAMVDYAGFVDLIVSAERVVQ